MSVEFEQAQPDSNSRRLLGLSLGAVSQRLRRVFSGSSCRYPEDHSVAALFHSVCPIVRQLVPAICVFGFMAIIPLGELEKVFIATIQEFVALYAFAFSLVFVALFSGLRIALHGTDNFCSRFIRRCESYWANFSMSLAAGILALFLGLFIPMIVTDGVVGAFIRVMGGVAVSCAFGAFTYLFTWTSSAQNLGAFERVRWMLGLGFIVVGAVLAIAFGNQLLLNSHG
ncbi:hypothetical protein GNX18_00685 [Microbulbifer sp. SH-1]|uniref:hypothetical protein n=1 Tax=Microbulbifer sp. SH-1 TaxID=2681547 RepID=UPI00140E8DFF|nr:hypothetical protein [Microbulbifer sp. SH-1]QIL88449.1 hypothetical protein GNX18_00685 [Microbulbifer sp. SH-1]